jgi:hypothetical protein
MVKASMKDRLNSKVLQILPFAFGCLTIPSIVWLVAIPWPILGLIETKPMVNPTTITNVTKIRGSW